MRPEPGLVGLRTLYSGTGGRIVDIAGELALTRPLDAGPITTTSPPPPPPHVTRPTRGKNKRVRSQSSSQSRSRSSTSPGPGSGSSTPKYRTWAHFNLAVGEREKIMAELLRRADNKERALDQLIRRGGGRSITPAGPSRNGGSTPAAGSATATTPPPPPSAHGSSSTASVASNISDRVQTYVSARLRQLRRQVLDQGYVTADQVDDILDEGAYVREEAMMEAIEEAVDRTVDEFRDRILGAFS
ncbi:hypothetical protein KVR01_001533 [Diaporthe batatas]|uniref:uncharacterized protein n=1 Tax=Diaporthe batatas TaxID=748121 RepID=UPI001D036D91|nr:uncharacterized protein KVR01_001533 [Diaporthe batatas]KAG8168784.1 hypothetical protein KVR01_001533 [Diaporthe batatas]